MRKVIVNMSVSLDGFMEGPNQDISWHLVDDEFNRYAIDLLAESDTMIFGRVAYQLMESYWPAAAVDPATSKDDLEIAQWFDKTPKIVFSRTLQQVNWQNARLAKNDITAEIANLKKQPGKNILCGGASLAQSMMKLGLIDEYRLLVHPLVLGSGKPLFENTRDRLHLKLLETRAFHSGVVLLKYEPAA